MTVPCQSPRSSPCKLAFLGEAPGDIEVEKGKPLVGPSGKIFNAMLRTAGLDRDDYWVGNVFDQKAPDNNVEPWLRDKAIWGPALERLERELRKAQPTVIVAMGGPALWALTGNNAISQMRGNVMQASRVMAGTKIVPTFHPAYVMRQWQMFPVTIEDFGKAKREADLGPGIIYPHRELLIEPTMREIEEYVPQLLASDLLSIDIETGWGQITCIGFAPDAEHAICIPFWDMRRPNRSYWRTAAEEVRVWQIVKQVCESNTPKLGQNFAFYDAFWLWDKYRIAVNNFQHDTRLMHHAIYPELPKSLSFLGASYGQQGGWKHWAGKKSDKRDD